MSEHNLLSSQAIILYMDDVDTDMIFPGRFLLVLDMAEITRRAFNDLRLDSSGKLKPDFPLNDPEKTSAEILIVGSNFGCGSSREQAAWTLRGSGFRCIIARSFGDIFYNNCFNSGILPIRLDDADYQTVLEAVQSGHELCVDAESCKLSTADKTIPFAVDSHKLRMIVEGLDTIGIILRDDMEAVASFEERDKAARPWLYEEPPASIF